MPSGPNIGGDAIPLPAGWVSVTSAKYAHLFIESAPVTFTLSNPNASSFEVRSYDGAIVKSGAVASTTLTFTGLPLGWYKLYLYRVTNDANYGHTIGYATFARIVEDARLPSPPAWGTVGGGEVLAEGQDHIIRGLSLSDPYRNVADAADPTSGPASIARVQADRAYQRDWYEANPDALRPRPSFLQFPNGGYQTPEHRDGVAEAVDAHYPDIEYFEGPTNEPNLALPDVATWMQTFATAVRTGNASAKVMGPNPVEIIPSAIGKLDAFLAAGGATGLDALSFHAYNLSTGGDFNLGRRTMDGLMRVLAKHGHAGIELWQTEWGIFAATYGVGHVQRQCQWWAAQRCILDQYGIPKERDYWFYDTSHGFWEFPSFYITEDRNVTALVPMRRVYAQEVHGKAWESKLDFGTVENDHYAGSRFEALDGSAALMLLSSGRTDGSAVFRVTGASSLTMADCWGATSTIPVTSGLATIPIVMEPTYLRLPAGCVATPETVVFGADLLRGAAASAPGGGLPSKAFNGRLENEYARTGERPYLSTTVLPADGSGSDYLIGTLAKPQWADTFIAHCPGPWQGSSSLLDADVEYRDAGGTWHVAQTITEPTLVVPALSDSTYGANRLDAFMSSRAIFRVDLIAPVFLTAVRLTVRKTTNGGEPTPEANAAGGQGHADKFLALRELTAYCRTPIPRRRTFASR